MKKVQYSVTFCINDTCTGQIYVIRSLTVRRVLTKETVSLNGRWLLIDLI